MEYLKINGQNFYNMMINASNKLEEQKEYVNSLNVFPVPDGDTGTNMSMTLKAAVLEIENLKTTSIGEVSKVLSKGALMGARGNSGVILSQILRGIAKALENKEEVDAVDFGSSLLEGSKAAYKAVMRPTEGTILTIIKAAGESTLVSGEDDIADLMAFVCEQSRIMLDKTPDMLPALKKAKVVDAGGMGLLIILKAMHEALVNDISYSIRKQEEVQSKEYAKPVTIEEEIKFGYCTEFFILGKNINAEKFKKDIEPLGDSMIVVGLEDVVKVHIHTNDPGLILSKAIKNGELSKVKIDNMREQHRSIIEESNSDIKDEVSSEVLEPKAYAFISVCMGEGIKNIFEDLGVDFVIEGGQTMNPSTQDILDCINRINAENIFVLPNNKNIIMAATQAADLSDKNVVVIPTKTIPQGITAVTLFNAEASLNENVDAMKEAINSVATGQITYAVRDTEMDGKTIKQGDILGLVEGKINEVGNNIYEVSENIISQMVNDESELITILYGDETEEDKVSELVKKLEEKYPQLDVQSFNGKQPLYYFIMSVE